MIVALAVIAALAVASIPLTVWVLALRDEKAHRAMMESSAQMLDRMLVHARDTQTPGEPATLTKARLAAAEKEIASRVEVAKARAAVNLGFDPLSD